MNGQLPGAGLPDLDLVLRYRLTVWVLPGADLDEARLDRWIAAHPRSVVVLPLTVAHNDPDAFVEALEQIVDGASPQGAGSGLQARAPSLRERVIEVLNALIEGPADLCIVFRGYGVIHVAEVHGLVSFILDYLPPNAHVLIIAGALPPLEALPRLLVRRQARLVRVPPEALAP